MSYVLKKLGRTDIEAIMKAAESDEKKHRFLKMRGGYFSNKVDPVWAYDEDRNYYLFAAPKADVRSSEIHYYFHFNGKLYEIHIDIWGDRLVVFDDPDVDRLPFFEELKGEIRSALEIHGIYGVKEEVPFRAIFKGGNK